jgi:hypothetical protein
MTTTTGARAKAFKILRSDLAASCMQVSKATNLASAVLEREDTGLDSLNLNPDSERLRFTAPWKGL